MNGKGDSAAEVEALRKDAERYRWLRDAAGAMSVFTAAYWGASTAEQMDAAIDDAMARTNAELSS